MMNPFTGESFEVSKVEYDFLRERLQYTNNQFSEGLISENERDLRICYLWSGTRFGKDFAGYLYKHLSQLRGKDLLQKQGEELAACEDFANKIDENIRKNESDLILAQIEGRATSHSSDGNIWSFSKQ